MNCIRFEVCKKHPAEQYRTLKQQRNTELRRQFYCKKLKGICRLTKCNFYDQCSSLVKKDFQEWNDAFKKDNKKLLEEIAGGS